jgi:hypothetical protein
MLVLRMEKLTAVRSSKIKTIFTEKNLNKYMCLVQFLQFYIGKCLLKCRLSKLNILFLKSSFMVYLPCTKIHIFNMRLLLFVYVQYSLHESQNVRSAFRHSPRDMTEIYAFF